VSNAPTLELRDAAVRRAGAALTAALSFSSSAERLGLVGDWSALLQALTGLAQVASGSVRVLGHDLESALAEGVLGLSLCDPPLPLSFTVTEYLEQAARLSHGSASRAARDTRHALERFGLKELASRKLAQTTVFQQRAVGIALASLTSPPVIWLESPLRGLDAPAAEYVAKLCAEAGTSSRVILSMPFPSSPSAERSLLEACDELFLLERGLLVARGTPSQVLAPSGRYLLSLAGENRAAYEGALREAGCVVTARDQLGDYVIELPAHESTDVLLDTALDQHVIVLELEPLRSAT
jgi:ABC-2 type transport system ATP-binding protein